MKTITFNIKNHSERMNIIAALQNNGYNTKIVTATEYIPPRVEVKVYVEDYEVEE